MRPKKATDKVNRVGHAGEVLDAIGGENEKQGIRWTKYFMSLWDKAQWQQNQIEKSKLKKHSKHKIKYYKLVEKMLNQKVLELERPAPGFWAETGFTPQGVWVKLHDRWGRTWTKAIKPCGIPKVDHNAIRVITGALEERMWSLEDTKVTDTGIYLA